VCARFGVRKVRGQVFPQVGAMRHHLPPMDFQFPRALSGTLKSQPETSWFYLVPSTGFGIVWFVNAEGVAFECVNRPCV